MKITMYELLGMVKDGKAPKKIKYNNEILYFDDETKNYYNDKGMHTLFNGVNYILNEEVEIIEEEKKIPEKLGKIDDNDGYIDQMDVIKIGKKVDEIIDYLKSKGDE